MVELKFDEKGLIATVVQDIATKDILMLAWMNAESLQKTSKAVRPGSGRVHGGNYGTRARLQATRKR